MKYGIKALFFILNLGFMICLGAFLFTGSNLFYQVALLLLVVILPWDVWDWIRWYVKIVKDVPTAQFKNDSAGQVDP